MNMKWKEQGHGSRSYLKPMLNRLKVMKGLTFIYAILETKLEKKTHESFHMPTI
jgi:hypothetical protein